LAQAHVVSSSEQMEPLADVFIFSYSWEEHQVLDLLVRLEQERMLQGVEENEWISRMLVRRNASGAAIDLQNALTETDFPVTVSLQLVPEIPHLPRQISDNSTVSEDTRQAIKALEEAEVLQEVAEFEALEEAEILRQVAEFEEQGTAELQDTASHSLAVVIRALLGVLSGESGVDKLILSCPFVLEEGAQITLHGMLDAWLTNFRVQAVSIPHDAPDSAVMKSMATAMRGVMQLVALVHPRDNQEHIQNLTKEWVLSVLVNVTGSTGSARSANTDRLENLLSVARDVRTPLPENVPEALRGFGCKEEAIRQMNDNEQRALLHKLWEWQESEEDEVFTAQQLVANGHLAPGLGLVVRQGNGDNVHVYVYDLGHLQRWVEQHHEDPLHQQLAVGGIIEIS